MRPIREALLAKVEAFCVKHGMSRHAFGLAAVGDERFVRRLASGKGVTLTTIERAERFMAEYERKEAQ